MSEKTNEQKIDFLRVNFTNEWYKKSLQVSDELSKSQVVKCVCGRLATGLHEQHCLKLRKKIEFLTMKGLSHLLPNYKFN